MLRTPHRARSSWLLALALALAALPLTGQERTAQEPPPEPVHHETEHSIVVGSQTVAYRAVVGSIILRDDQERPSGELFYTAYFRTNAGSSAARPIIFSYNGGPGSASFWLHMGIMGPRRVRTPVVGPQAPPPYEIVDNAFTVLDRADIVMVDPIGTGFSRPIGETPGSTFWGVDEDAASLTQFIRRFLSEYDRWNSPRYLLGESYGTTRSAVLAGHLQDANIDLNGIVLVSTVLQFSTIQFAPGDNTAYITNLPSYALVAEYLDALPGGPVADVDAFMAEVEAFALGDYATALLAGTTLAPAERARIIERLHAYTGLDPDFIDRADLRVTASEFEAELLRERGLVVGRFDARFTGPAGDLISTRPSHDPQSTSISSAYMSAFNAYLRGELRFATDREYTPGGGASGWNWDRQRGGNVGFGGAAANVAPDLATAIRRNPNLEVLLVNGLYDLATPYFAAVWSIDQMGLPPELRDNVERVDFAAGHMMYVEESLLPQWKQMLDSFLDRTSGRRPAS